MIVLSSRLAVNTYYTVRKNSMLTKPLELCVDNANDFPESIRNYLAVNILNKKLEESTE